MKHSNPFCRILVFALVVIACESAVEAQEWARRMFDKHDHDFGSIAKAALTEYRFQIKNLYKQDIHISSVSASCGCTTPKLTTRLIKPGETGELIAHFNTDRFQGQHSATLTVRFSRPSYAEVRVKVRGYVRRDVVVFPGRIEFGSVDAEEGAEHKVQILYAGRNDWEILDVRSANPDFEVELKPTHRGGGRVNYDLMFRVKKGASEGYVNDQLILVTNDRNRSTVPVAVEGTVVPSISVTPASLQLGSVRPGQLVTKQLVVRGKTPFRISSVACESGDKCFQFRLGDAERKLHLIPVTYTASDKPGKFVERIQVVLAGSDRKLPDVLAHVEVLAE
jgi:hypothetical protein